MCSNLGMEGPGEWILLTPGNYQDTDVAAGRILISCVESQHSIGTALRLKRKEREMLTVHTSIVTWQDVAPQIVVCMNSPDDCGHVSVLYGRYAHEWASSNLSPWFSAMLYVP